MRTNTNWEDNQLIRDAAKNQARRERREREVQDTVSYAFDRLVDALFDDYGITAGETARRLLHEIARRAL